MDIFIIILVYIVIFTLYYSHDYNQKLELEKNKQWIASTFAKVNQINKDKKTKYGSCRVSIYDNMLIVMRMSQISRYYTEIRDYKTGIASMRHNFKILRDIFKESKHIFAHLIITEKILKIEENKQNKIISIKYLDESNQENIIEISKSMLSFSNYEKLRLEILKLSV